MWKFGLNLCHVRVKSKIYYTNKLQEYWTSIDNARINVEATASWIVTQVKK